MKKRRIHVVSIVLLLALLLVGCKGGDATIEPDVPTPGENGGTEETPTDTPSEPSVEPDEPSTEPDEPSVEPDEPIAEPDEPSYHVSPSLEKIGATTENVSTSIGTAFVVSLNRYQYTIMDIAQGKKLEDTYINVNVVGEHFVVTKTPPEDKNDFAGINSTGVVTSALEQTVPCEYALIEHLAGDYAVAYKVTELTEDRNEALLYMASSMFTLEPEEGDPLYRGEWCVIELSTGRTLEGLSGTSRSNISLVGDVILVRTQGEPDIRVNVNGYVIPDGAKLLENGCYIPKDEYAVYSSTGERLFEFGKNDIVPSSVSEDTFLTGKVDNTTYTPYYWVVDKTGTAISIEVAKSPSVYCNRIINHETGVYLYNGTKISEEKAYLIHEEDGYYFLDYNDRVLILDSDFNAVLDLTGENLYADRTNMLVGQEDEKYRVTYYSIPQKDFVYKGYSVAPWLVEVAMEDGTKQLVNVLTDEILISGCHFLYTSKDSEGRVYFLVSDGDQKICYRLN